LSLDGPRPDTARLRIALPATGSDEYRFLIHSTGGTLMNPEFVIGGLMAAALFAYLLYALARPERF